MSSARRDVVSVVLQRVPSGLVLLLQRSDSVSTFARHWHFVSGALEPADQSLVQRAEAEVREETRLPLCSAPRAVAGRPLLVPPFRVFPFKFEVDDADADAFSSASLNWENCEFAWADPERILRGHLLQQPQFTPSVPRLRDTLERVSMQLNDEEAAAIAFLRADRQHGAAQLARYAVDALLRCAPPYCSVAHLLDFAFQLTLARPSMAPLANCVAHVLQRAGLGASGGGSGGGGGGSTRLAKAVREFVASEAEADANLRSNAVRQLSAIAASKAAAGDARPLKVLTTSFSSTICHVLVAYAQQHGGGSGVSVVVAESRPLNEGRLLATQLGLARVPCTLISDAQLYVEMEGVDVVLLGADTLLSDGSIINKVGSRSMAVAAIQYNAKCLCVTSTNKLWNGVHSRCPPIEEMDGDEIWPNAGATLKKHIRVRNVYFEVVPSSLGLKLVTEKDLDEAISLPTMALHLCQQYEDVFCN